MTNYLLDALKKPETQADKLSDDQIQNSDGAFVYQTSLMQSLRRFLILGSEGGSYYASESALTKQNATRVILAINTHGLEAVSEIVKISESGRAPKNEPALFALALAMNSSNMDVKREAYKMLPRVARTGTHLFHWAAYFDSIKGWGMGARKAVSKWYLDKDARSLAYQITKYASRDGWTHKDMLRLCHIQAKEQNLSVHDPSQQDVFNYIVHGDENLGNLDSAPDGKIEYLWAVERVKKCTDQKELVSLIEKYRLPMEVIPTDQRSDSVYEAILQHANLGWTIRNLGNLSKHGILVEGRKYNNLELVANQLTDESILEQARIHPLSVLSAYNTYEGGKSIQGSGVWKPVSYIVDALNEAFYKSFQFVEKSNKRFVLGIDVSGSMTSGMIANLAGITPRVGAAAMAMVTKRTEPFCATMGFSNEFIDLNIKNSDGLDDVIKKTSALPFRSTDCSLPMTWALKNNIEADAFVVYTDNETNHYGSEQPAVALNKYRDKTGINAKLIVVGMVSNNFTVADPNDNGMLDVVGFDSSAPSVISQFAAGQI